MLGLQVLFITPTNPPATRSAMPLTSDPTRRLAHSRMCDVPLANVCHQSAPLLLPLEYIVPNHLSDLSADSHGHAFTHRLPPTPSWIEHSEEQCRGVSYQVRTIDLRFRQFEKSFGRGPWHVVVSRNPARESNPPSQSRDSDAHRACSVSPFKDKISPPADGAARFYCAGDARVPRAPSPPRRPPLILPILVSNQTTGTSVPLSTTAMLLARRAILRRTWYVPRRCLSIATHQSIEGSASLWRHAGP